jgi:cell division protein FtsB
MTREEWDRAFFVEGTMSISDMAKAFLDWQESDEKKDAEIADLKAENKELAEQIAKLKAMLEMLEPGSPFL